MLDRVGIRANLAMRPLLLLAAFALLIPIISCKQKGAESAAVSATPQTFASPDEAANALQAAAKSQDQNDLLRIFGSGASDVLFTGDSVQDKSGLDGFSQAYQVMKRWRSMPDGSEVLVVGPQNEPFPVPLKKNASGQWYFDANTGRDEILSRRIGQNEITTIAVLSTGVEAQHQYFAQKHGGVSQYAQKFLSDPGQQNGLYWETRSGAPQSPLGPLAADATAEGYKIQPGQHKPYHGYYYSLLTKQGTDARGGEKSYIVEGKMTGGFGILAYPVKYGDSGIQTFLVNQDGVIFEKDLGKSTDQAASAITSFDPDKTWRPIAQ
jgi:hypothetical protein